MTRQGGTVGSPGRRTGAWDGGAGGAGGVRVRVVDEGGTVDSPGRRTGARDGGAGGAGRARVRRGRRRWVGLAGVCRTR